MVFPDLHVGPQVAPGMIMQSVKQQIQQVANYMQLVATMQAMQTMQVAARPPLPPPPAQSLATVQPPPLPPPSLMPVEPPPPQSSEVGTLLKPRPFFTKVRSEVFLWSYPSINLMFFFI